MRKFFRNILGGRGALHSPGDTHLAAANTLLKSGKTEEAELQLRQAIALSPESQAANKALGRLFLETGRPVDAERILRKVLGAEPENRDVLAWLGQALFFMHDYHNAWRHLARANAIVSLDSREHYWLAAALLYSGRMEEAGKILKAGLELDPSEPALVGMLALQHLLCGNWREGFRHYETRFRQMRDTTAQESTRTSLEILDSQLAGISAWSGEEIVGKSLLVWNEQGLGDAIMMLRLVSVLGEERGAASVTFLGAPPLENLVKRCTPIRFLDARHYRQPIAGEFDFQCSIMSLPYLMNIDSKRISGLVPYIRMPESLSSAWGSMFQSSSDIRVGVAWAGNPTLGMDVLRSINLSQLEPLFSCGGAFFVSLQKDDAAREELRTSGLPLTDWMDRCYDFADTAALIDNLDLVISVDTAVAHLAGAMGKPVWLLNRFESEWRWMRGREDSVWYPSMHIFNQTESRNWGPIINRMAAELRALVATVAG